MLRLFFCLWIFLAVPLFAEAPAPDLVDVPTITPTAPEIPIPEYQGVFIKMFLTLIGLVVAIFFTIWALKRLSHGRLHQINSNKTIKILERRPLSAKTILYLIEVSGKQAMIAESQLEIKRILSFDDLTSSELEKTE